MKTGTLFLNEQASVSLTCYLHEQSVELANCSKRPAVLVLPGGGYRMCSDREAEPVALAYMAEGYQAFVLRYSLNTDAQFPAPLKDAEKALETVFSNAEEWGVDKDKVAVIGFSAGGHLAAMLGTSGRIRPAALILGYPCILAKMADNGVLPHPIPGADEAVDADTPPCFMFTTRDDALVPVENTLRFAEALNREGTPFEMHIFAKGTHGMSLGKPSTSAGIINMVNLLFAGWFPMSVDWLKDLWGDFVAEYKSNQVAATVETEYTAYSIDVPLQDLMANPSCQALLTEKIPFLADEDVRKMAMFSSLRIIAGYSGDAISDALLAELNETLKSIPMQGGSS